MVGSVSLTVHLFFLPFSVRTPFSPIERLSARPSSLFFRSLCLSYTVLAYSRGPHEVHPQNGLLSETRQLGTGMHHIAHGRFTIGVSTAVQVICRMSKRNGKSTTITSNVSPLSRMSKAIADKNTEFGFGRWAQLDMRKRFRGNAPPAAGGNNAPGGTSQVDPSTAGDNLA